MSGSVKASMSHIRPYQVLPWAKGPLCLRVWLKNQVTKMAKSSFFWLLFFWQEADQCRHKWGCAFILSVLVNVSLLPPKNHHLLSGDVHIPWLISSLLLTLFLPHVRHRSCTPLSTTCLASCSTIYFVLLAPGAYERHEAAQRSVKLPYIVCPILCQISRSEFWLKSAL